jgi:tetratricopeptide (TPR) repeat protein
MRVSKLLVALLVFVPMTGSIARPGQRLGNNAAVESAHFGQVHFAVSCSPPAQKSFNTAVALLHSFQYEEASKAFGEVAEEDPHCAMAYWGKAMSLYEQLWDFPGAAQLKQGREYIEKAEQAGAETERERLYIAAAAAFYQNSSKLSHDARTRAYSKAMQSLYGRYPGGVNAGAFYALSLVALGQNRQAIAILDKLFAQYPGNPGVDHYLIHASDSPELAPYGLAAARNYAKIAPDSAHALHMPSHIFTRLGYWRESIESNLDSAAAAEAATKSGRDNEQGYQRHALTFLEYAYLQSGQDADARHVIADLATVPGVSRTALMEDHALFQATYDLETHAWKDAAALMLLPADGYLGDRVEICWTRAIGAARSGDVAGARDDLRKLKAAYAAMHSAMKKQGYKPAPSEGVLQMETEAWLDDAEGNHGQALKTMRVAVNKEGPDGVDILGMPAQEMLGDLLLERREPSQALTAYEAALKESPNRFDALYGAAQAAELAGNVEQAQFYYASLLKICGPHADRHELQRAKIYLAQRPGARASGLASR